MKLQEFYEKIKPYLCCYPQEIKKEEPPLLNEDVVESDDPQVVMLREIIIHNKDD